MNWKKDVQAGIPRWLARLMYQLSGALSAYFSCSPSNFLSCSMHHSSKGVTKVEMGSCHCIVKRSSIPSNHEFVLVQMGLL